MTKAVKFSKKTTLSEEYKKIRSLREDFLLLTIIE